MAPRASETIDNKIATQANKPREIQALVEKDVELATMIRDPEQLKRLRRAALSFYSSQLRSPNKKQAEAMRQVEPRSFLNAVVEAAADGLLPNGIDGWIVPRGTGCTWTKSWRGLLKLVRRSMESRGCVVTSIAAEVVREADTFSCDLAARAIGPHVPELRADAGRIVAAYAIIEWSDKRGEIHRVWRLINWSEIERRAQRSGSTYDKNWSSVWSEWTDSMARKSAIRALADWIDLDDGAMASMQREDEEDTDAEEDAPHERQAVKVEQVEVASEEKPA